MSDSKPIPQEDEIPISITSTSCGNCVFAEYVENTQTGCSANRLEKFKKANIPIIEMKYDDTISLIVDGKTCVYYRNEGWSKEYYKTDDKSHILTCVEKELRIPYHVLLFVRADNVIEDVRKRLTELQSQKIKPKIVTIIDRSHSTNIITGELMKVCQEYSFAHWRIQSIQATDQIDDDVVDLAYDNTKKMKYLFYMIVECDHKIPITLAEEIHRSVHDDMKSFVVLLPNSQGVGKTVLKVAHEKYAGNSFGIPLEKKIVHYDDAPHLIKKVEEICPSLQSS